MENPSCGNCCESHSNNTSSKNVETSSACWNSGSYSYESIVTSVSKERLKKHNTMMTFLRQQVSTDDDDQLLQQVRDIYIV